MRDEFLPGSFSVVGIIVRESDGSLHDIAVDRIFGSDDTDNAFTALFSNLAGH